MRYVNGVIQSDGEIEALEKYMILYHHKGGIGQTDEYQQFFKDFNYKPSLYNWKNLNVDTMNSYLIDSWIKYKDLSISDEDRKFLKHSLTVFNHWMIISLSKKGVR